MPNPEEEDSNFVDHDYNPLSTGMSEMTLSEEEMLALSLKELMWNTIEEQAA